MIHELILTQCISYSFNYSDFFFFSPNCLKKKKKLICHLNAFHICCFFSLMYNDVLKSQGHPSWKVFKRVIDANSDPFKNVQKYTVPSLPNVPNSAWGTRDDYGYVHILKTNTISVQMSILALCVYENARKRISHAHSPTLSMRVRGSTTLILHPCWSHWQSSRLAMMFVFVQESECECLYHFQKPPFLSSAPKGF